MVLNSQRRDKSLRNSFENRTSRGTKRGRWKSSSFFVYPSPGALLLWRLGRLVFGRRLLLSQSFVFDRWLSLKMNFQPSSVKPKQSMIVIASLRSAQTCCDRSTPIVEWVYLVYGYEERNESFSLFSYPSPGSLLLWRLGRLVCAL